MRSAAFLLLSALFLVLATPALAGEWVEGDGFRLRLPPEFVDIKKAKVSGQEELQQALDLAESFMPAEMGFDLKAFVRMQGTEPDAVLMAMAIHLQGQLGEVMEGASIDQLEQGMRQQQARLERSDELVEISRIRRILVSAGRPAIEMEVNFDDPAAGPLNSLRMVFALDGGSMYMLGFQGQRRNASSDAILWRAIVTSFRLDERNSVLGMLMRFGPFILGGLVLLIALVFLRKSSSRRIVRPMLSTRPGGGDGGFSRALDGLPTYGQTRGDPADRSLDGAPAQVEAIPAPVRMGGGNGPLKAPTIPRAAPPVDEPVGPHGGGAFAPVPALAPAPVEAASTPSGGPSGLPRGLPPAPSVAAPQAFAPPPPPPPPPRPSPAGPMPPPAVAGRVGIGQPPAGSDMPTNVALRGAQERVPQADDTEEVLTRLMGFEDAPPRGGNGGTPSGKGKKEGARITRNSDFFG